MWFYQFHRVRSASPEFFQPIKIKASRNGKTLSTRAYAALSTQQSDNERLYPLAMLRRAVPALVCRQQVVERRTCPTNILLEPTDCCLRGYGILPRECDSSRSNLSRPWFYMPAVQRRSPTSRISFSLFPSPLFPIYVQATSYAVSLPGCTPPTNRSINRKGSCVH